MKFVGHEIWDDSNWEVSKLCLFQHIWLLLRYFLFQLTNTFLCLNALWASLFLCEERKIYEMNIYKVRQMRLRHWNRNTPENASFFCAAFFPLIIEGWKKRNVNAMNSELFYVALCSGMDIEFIYFKQSLIRFFIQSFKWYETTFLNYIVVW